MCWRPRSITGLGGFQLPGLVSVLQVRQEPEEWPLKGSVGPAKARSLLRLRGLRSLTARGTCHSRPGKCPVNTASHIRTLVIGVSPEGAPLVSPRSGTDPRTHLRRTCGRWGHGAASSGSRARSLLCRPAAPRLASWGPLGASAGAGGPACVPPEAFGEPALATPG